MSESLFTAANNQLPILQCLRRVIKRDGKTYLAVRKYQPRSRKNETITQ